MNRRTALAYASAAFIAVSLTACGGGDDQATSKPSAGSDLTLRIGMSAALEGAYAAYDAPYLKGMQFAADEINKAGGLDGINVEIVQKNNKGDQQLTATTTQELLDDGVNVFALTGADGSVAQGQIISQAGGLMTLGINTAPQLGEDIGDRAFYLVATDELGGSAAGEYACDKGFKSVYTIGSPEIPYTKNMPRYFAQSFARCGGEVVGEDSYKIGQTEFASVVTKIKNASPAPDVIFTPMFVPDSGAFLKALRGAGVTTPVVSTDGNDSKLFAESGGEAVDGTVFATHAFPKPGSLAAKFAEDFQAAQGEPLETNVFEAMGRDNVYALTQAAARAKSTEAEAVRGELLKMKDFEGVTGTMTMDPATRRVKKTVTLVKMEGTKPTLLRTLIPKFVPAA